MKITAILRIKDEILYGSRCLEKLSELVDDIIVLDNGSTDGTLEMYKKFPKIKKVLQTVGFDEGRDKCLLLEEAKKDNPDWILWTDADEVFENNFTRQDIDRYMSSGFNRIVFRMCNFWLSESHCRYDGEWYLYSLHPQRSMWRNLPETYFVNKKIHNGDIQGLSGKSFLSPFRLKHFGYSNRDKIKKKYETYIKEDTSGTRSYSNINPDAPAKTFYFREYKNQLANLFYIQFYKLLLNILWVIERLRLKIVKKINVRKSK
jgi:glycosyltransferase involved in cell wall biosynthesis